MQMNMRDYPTLHMDTN